MAALIPSVDSEPTFVGIPLTLEYFLVPTPPIENFHMCFAVTMDVEGKVVLISGGASAQRPFTGVNFRIAELFAVIRLAIQNKTKITIMAHRVISKDAGLTYPGDEKLHTISVEALDYKWGRNWVGSPYT